MSKSEGGDNKIWMQESFKSYFLLESWSCMRKGERGCSVVHKGDQGSAPKPSLSLDDAT